ncbi:MAG: hypothetical protein IJ851_07260 [Eubacterium sp.]|nr:hypothetical protein [Eubacterium sp.]
MKNKTKVIIILMLNFAFLVAGTGVAYYNTKSFGFDESAKLVYADDEKFTYMDFSIYYKDIKPYYNKLRQYLPEKSLSTTLENQQIVYHI